MSLQDLAYNLYSKFGVRNNGRTIFEIVQQMENAIRNGKGTCFCCMLLNPLWENLPTEYNISTGEFEFRLPLGGVSDILFGERYMSFNGKEAINMMSMLFCKQGGIIRALESGQLTKRLLDDAYETMNRWLLEGYSGVSQEELIIAMEYLAANGDQNNICSLQCVGEDVLDKSDEVDKEMYKRINSSIEREKTFDFMILAWTNYWNITMEREYGKDNYSPVRAEVVKAMLVVESNMGQDNTENNYIKNPERDIMQALDCRNPVVWSVINDNGNGKTIEIVYAQKDVNEFSLDSSKEYELEMKDSGNGAKSYYGNGSWKVVNDLFSSDHSIYYAGEVTPEISLAVGTAEYCRLLNGSGTNGGVSTLGSESIAAEKYNGGGDSNYIYKVNLVLDNMGVSNLAQPKK